MSHPAIHQAFGVVLIDQNNVVVPEAIPFIKALAVSKGEDSEAAVQEWGNEDCKDCVMEMLEGDRYIVDFYLMLQGANLSPVEFWAGCQS